jgi:DNA polymerase-3 subunit chi
VTQVDFYILDEDSTNALLNTACRIAEKAMKQQQHIYVNAQSEVQARNLDDLLWTFSQGSFVPHRLVEAGGAQNATEPVLVGFGDDPKNENWQLIINLADAVPEFFSRYERMIEIIDANLERRTQGRERYRFYKERGYQPNTHNI